MSPPIALYDACVLHSAPLRDLLVHLATAKVVSARWTDAIHEEWIRSVLARRTDLTRERLERTRRLMDIAVPDALVTGHEMLLDQLNLPDPDDRHVLAAAITARADWIVTFNLTDFPAEALEPRNLQAIHPDAFVRVLLDRAPQDVCQAVRVIRLRLLKPAKSVGEHLETLEAQGLPASVARLRAFSESL